MSRRSASDLASACFSAEKLLELSAEEWLLRRKVFRNSEKSIQANESIFTIGNGYLNVRGSLEELPPGHCGGMYISGIYDKSEADVEELVKCPMWTDVSVWSEGEKFCLSCCKILFHEQVLDMKKGVLHRLSTLKNAAGKIITIQTARLVFMHNVHLGYLFVKVTPRNFSAPLRVLSGLNGDVCNRGYFPREMLKHLQLEKIERGRAFMYLEMKTRDRGIRISEAASWKLISHDASVQRWEPRIYGEKFTSEITIDAQKGESYIFEKLCVVLTSREVPDAQLYKETICQLKAYVRSTALNEIAANFTVWQEKWKQSDVVIVGDEEAQKALRFNIYHLLINGPPRVGSIGAKFLSSEGYLGHVFWDTEIFILPFYIYNFPEIARNMLLYRYHTLPGAVKNAVNAGCTGAKYAWESATTGEDVTPRFASKLEKTIRFIYTGTEEDHIVSDVIYGLEKYFRVTGDESFLLEYGLEMLFMTARFWASRVVKVDDSYEIHCVIGPDEFHEHVNNNAYTNFMVKWHLELAATLYGYMHKKNPVSLDYLCRKICFNKSEADNWLVISRNMKFSVDPQTRLFEQFDGYFNLRDYVFSGYDRTGHPTLPRGVNYRTIGSTTLIKQADVVIMMLLFPHNFSDEEKRVNYEYYEQRTAHKSSLSHCTYAMMGLAIGKRTRAYSYFMKTALFDLDNLHKNTHLGIHAAAVGGTWQTVVNGFGGLSIKSDRIVMNPWLPKKWESLSFTVRWKARFVDINIFHDRISILIRSEDAVEIPLSLYRKTYKIKSNEVQVLHYCSS
ncbi:glycoside hydrolase family 65 protein [Chlorobium phaeobacteroides]|uniref:Kojibiose phosphorylase n=1 Tax=Chlorobium phaeobacteroides (strain DSM 266 / SMG 266 / 2430) TaxID=290317 RepID=A1BFQ3_CHLPD|nr:glycosyl hydrolase family 65 protein [Chlorobium phaeobacteroides]ABL65230.1 Kojibiose phosphorylase [Chlorobium phaeobacteroides DSM 266]